MNPGYDVVVVGAGPAGARAAATLAGADHRVLLVEAGRHERPRIGETLPPSAVALLGELGRSVITGSVPCTPAPAQFSAWGEDVLRSRPFLFDPYGDGAHVDRRAFDRALTDAAAEAGAVVNYDTRVTACTRTEDRCWELSLRGATTTTVTVPAVVDATGRTAALARLLRVERRPHDRLTAVAVRFRTSTPRDHTVVESTRTGWWYVAPTPPDGVVAVLLTDADLCRDQRLTRPDRWWHELSMTRHVRERLAGAEPVGTPEVHNAAGHHLDQSGPPGRWLAVGDAAMAVDPLSSSGIERALSTGHLGGLAMAYWLNGQPDPALDYRRWLAAQFDRYRQERTTWYRLENRWPTAPFWHRRHAASTPLTPGGSPDRSSPARS